MKIAERQVAFVDVAMKGNDVMSYLKTDYGEYLKGFFVIKLDMVLKENIRVDEFSKNEFATFVHEYIHFLQNVSTVHGMYYFNTTSKLVQLFISEAYKCDDLIRLPINKEIIENAYEACELQSFYEGTSEHKKIHHVNEIKIENDEMLEDEIKLSNIECVNIYYDDKDIPYTFGTICIEESMAYLIENKQFGALDIKNELPYNSCELVCETICPSLIGRANIMVALLEISLMHYNSGVMFCKLLEEIKNKHLNFKNTLEVFSYFNNKTNLLYSNMKEQYSEIFSAIDFLYPLKTPFENTNFYLKKVIKKAYRYRCEKSSLISNIMDLSTKKSNEYFVFLLNTFGVPALIDKSNDIYSTEFNLGLALVPIAIFNQFNSNVKQCYLYDYCSKGNMKITDNNCLYSPWKQSTKETLCPFAIFWYHYLLDGKEIRKKNELE